MKLLRWRLAVELGQRWLWIESVHMAGAAVHEQINHRLRLRGKMRGTRCERIRHGWLGGMQPTVARQQRGQRHAADSATRVAQPIAAGKQ